MEGQVLATWGATYPVAYEYDAFGRMSAMYTLRDSSLVISNYSSFITHTSSFDRTAWLYDLSTGLLTNKVYADGRGPSYTYMHDGKLQTRTWARGITTTYIYTNTGELVTIDYSDGTPDVSFTYNRLGQQATVTDAQGVRVFTYNDKLQLAAETNTFAGIQRAFDGLGRSTGFDLSDGSYSVRYNYTDVGRFGGLSSVINGRSNAWQYAYLPNSDLISGWSNTAAGVQATRAFETHRNLLALVQNKTNGAVASSFDYSNDALGRRSQRIDNASVTNVFGYNVRSEVTSAAMGTNQYGYAYDPIGNRQVASNNTEALTYAANALNQYTNITIQPSTVNHPSYDFDGNLTNYGAFAFSWDGENRLVGVSSNGQAVASYAYDYMSRRYQKACHAGGVVVTNTFLYDGWAMIRETAGAGLGASSTNLYVYGLDLSGTLQGAGTIGGILASVDSAGSTRYYFYDGNGNVTDLIDTNGAAVAHYEYDPYGNTIVKTGALADTNPFRFSTKYLDDETSLYYYGHRYCSPNLGRWLSRDPLGRRAGINPYVMCGNAPTDLADVLGMVPTLPSDFVRFRMEYVNAFGALEDLTSHSFNDIWLRPRAPGGLTDSPDAAGVSWVEGRAILHGQQRPDGTTAVLCKELWVLLRAEIDNTLAPFNSITGNRSFGYRKHPEVAGSTISAFFQGKSGAAISANLIPLEVVEQHERGHLKPMFESAVQTNFRNALEAAFGPYYNQPVPVGFDAQVKAKVTQLWKGIRLASNKDANDETVAWMNANVGAPLAGPGPFFLGSVAVDYLWDYNNP